MMVLPLFNMPLPSLGPKEVLQLLPCSMSIGKKKKKKTQPKSENYVLFRTKLRT